MFHRYCAPQDRFNEFGFGLIVSLAVVAELPGE
jgi:hypothetical protein